MKVFDFYGILFAGILIVMYTIYTIERRSYAEQYFYKRRQGEQP